MRKPSGRTVLVGTLLAIGMLAIALLGYAVGLQATDYGVPAQQRAMQPGVAGRDMALDSAGSEPQALLTAPSPDQSEAAVEDGSQSPSASDALVIRNAAMEVRVRDVDASLTELRSAVTESGGEIAELSVTSGDPGVIPLGDASAPSGPSAAYVTIRVPAEALPALETRIGTLGTVVNQSSSAQDVTEQAIDLDARVKNLRAEESRLRSLFDRTDDVGDLLNVERELARVRGEIESITAQLTYLKRQAARATLTVTLTEPGPVVQPDGPTWGLRDAVTRGIQATASLLAFAVTLAIPMAFLGGIALLGWLPIRALLKHRAARRAREDGDTSRPPGEAS